MPSYEMANALKRVEVEGEAGGVDGGGLQQRGFFSLCPG